MDKVEVLPRGELRELDELCLVQNGVRWREVRLTRSQFKGRRVVVFLEHLWTNLAHRVQVATGNNYGPPVFVIIRKVLCTLLGPCARRCNCQSRTVKLRVTSAASKEDMR